MFGMFECLMMFEMFDVRAWSSCCLSLGKRGNCVCSVSWLGATTTIMAAKRKAMKKKAPSKQAMKKAPSKQAKRSQCRKAKKALAMMKKSAFETVKIGLLTKSVKMEDCKILVDMIISSITHWYNAQGDKMLCEGCQEL